MATDMRHMPRQPVMDKKDYSMSVISFKRMDWTDLVASLVDMSPQGAGIEVERRIDPGYVWFSDTVDGRKGGMLMWSMQRGGKYRGGIKFVDLTPEEEQHVEEKLAGSGPLKDPAVVVDMILESLQKNVEDSPWDAELDQ